MVNEKLAEGVSAEADIADPGGASFVHRSSQETHADFGLPITMPVIGVVADIHESGRATTMDPECSLPYTLEVWPWMNFAVRAPTAGRVVAAVTRAVHDVDPSIEFARKPSVQRTSVRRFDRAPFLTMVISGFAACATAHRRCRTLPESSRRRCAACA